MTTGVAGGAGAAALVSFLGGGGDCLAGASSLSGVAVVRRSLTLPKNDCCASVTSGSVTSSA